MKIANLFLVGAPRSGTTSLAFWLARHPDVALAKPKEPSYYVTDLPMKGRVADADAYAAAFSHATQETYRLDATPWYLYSPAAAQGIAASVPEAHIIVNLRNPAEMLPSLHNHHVFKELESQPDLATALFSTRVPDSVDFRRGLDYLDVGRLGQQVERFLESFPHERVHFVPFEHLVEHPEDTHRGLLRRLGLDDTPLDDYPRLNPAKDFRSQQLRRVANLVADRSSPLWRRRIAGRLRRWNSVAEAGDIPGHIRQQIGDALADDVDLLARLTDLDLSGWKTV